jgi:hypothetical protein
MQSEPQSKGNAVLDGDLGTALAIKDRWIAAGGPACHHRPQRAACAQPSCHGMTACSATNALTLRARP